MQVPPSPFRPRGLPASGPVSLKTPKSTRSDLERARDGLLHRYGCLMLSLPLEQSARLKGWVHARVLPHHLSEEGLEDYHHVTLKYGFTGDDDAVLSAVKGIMARNGPVTVRLTGLSHFPDSGDGEVLKLSVESRELHDLYHFLSSHFICVDRHYPDYKPHLTLAYLKSGNAKHYTQLKTPLDGLELTLDEAVYSTAEKKKHTIPLSGRKAMSWLGETSGGALVKPPEFMGRKPEQVMPLLRDRKQKGNVT